MRITTNPDHPDDLAIDDGNELVVISRSELLQALAEAGVLYEEGTGPHYDTDGVMESPKLFRYVSPWREAK